MAEAGGIIAVTGGTGFLGRYVVSALLDAGWTPRVLARTPRAVPDGAQTVVGSLAEPGALARLLDGAQAMIHAAGLIKAHRNGQFFSVNGEGSRSVAAAVAQHDPTMRVVMVSSMAAREPTLSPYARSKRAGERAIMDSRLSNWVVVRPPAIYGPGDRETQIFFQAAQGPILPIPNRPNARLCLIHARDAARAVAALVADGPSGRIVELSDSQTDGYDWPTLAQAIKTATGGKARIVRVPAPVYVTAAFFSQIAGWLSGNPPMLTFGKVREMLHPDWGSCPSSQPDPLLWRPSIDLADGLAETAQWYRAHPVPDLPQKTGPTKKENAISD